MVVVLGLEKLFSLTMGTASLTTRPGCCFSVVNELDEMDEEDEMVEDVSLSVE